MRSSPRLIRKAAIAVLAGCAVGAAAAAVSVSLWSRSADRSPAAAKAVGISTPQRSSVAAAAVQTASEPREASAPAAGAGPESVAVATGGAAPRDEPQLQRARELARRADVKALMALRDGLSQQAEANGAAPPASKQLLDRLERYLTEARALRLKLDGDALRGATR